MKIRPVRAELFHAVGRTDMMKLIVAFRNFVDAPKNQSGLGNEYFLQTIILLIAILRANIISNGPRFPIATLNLNTLTHVAMVKLVYF
jgi:hypothetical protein